MSKTSVRCEYGRKTRETSGEFDLSNCIFVDPSLPRHRSRSDGRSDGGLMSRIYKITPRNSRLNHLGSRPVSAQQAV